MKRPALPTPSDFGPGTIVSRCPRCATSGILVPRLTVKALLTESALRRFATMNYRFCRSSGCDVVYFSSTGQPFTVDDVRVGVWQKQPSGSRTICYCFDENETAMREEIERTGISKAGDRVRHHIEAGRCACEVRNPRGACCLSDLMAAVKRIEKTRHPSHTEA